MKIRFEEEKRGKRGKSTIEWRLYNQKKMNDIGEKDIEKEMGDLCSCVKILEQLVNHSAISGDAIEKAEHYIEKDTADMLLKYNYLLTEGKKDAKVPISCAKCACFAPALVYKCSAQHFLCGNCYFPAGGVSACPVKNCKGKLAAENGRPVNKVEPMCFECQSSEHMETHWDRTRNGEKCLLAACRDHREEFGDLVAGNYGKCPRCESDLAGCFQ